MASDGIVVVPKSPSLRKGKKSRKFGRKKTRSTAQARYNAEKRWLVNKARRILKNNGEVALEAFCDRHTLPRKSLGL